MRVYYYVPLVFHFTSGMTIQVIRDLTHLSRLGHEVYLFGTYTDEAAFEEIKQYIDRDSVFLLSKKGSNLWSILLQYVYLWKIIRDASEEKVIIGRNYWTCASLFRLRPLLKTPLMLMETHEWAFPHLLTDGSLAPKIQKAYTQVFEKLTGLVLTNFSQEVILKQEFDSYPAYKVFPNSVEWDTFHEAGRLPDDANPLVITSITQFKKWKNAELLFAALALLDERYVLRMAGGKGDKKSKEYVDRMISKYSLEGRVDYRGFVSPHRIVTDVLDGSSVLLLPLGDNLIARYFTSPMKLFEYMATKIPVVAVDYPSVNLVTGNDTVFLATNDPQDFADAIELAAHAPDKAERVARMNEVVHQYTYAERSSRFHAWLQELHSQASRIKPTMAQRLGAFAYFFWAPLVELFGSVQFAKRIR